MRISDWSSDVCSSDLCGMFPQKLIESTEINGCVNDPKNRLAKKLDGEDAKTILNKANPTRFVNANTSSNNASKAVVVFLFGPFKPAEPAVKIVKRKIVMEEQSVSVRVDIDGGGIIEKKN